MMQPLRLLNNEPHRANAHPGTQRYLSTSFVVDRFTLKRGLREKLGVCFLWVDG